MSAAKRRRRQAKMGYTHVAKICGGTFSGGRPIYRRKSTTLADAIMRERAAVAREMQRKMRKSVK